MEISIGLQNLIDTSQWDTISRYQILSEEFIEKHLHQVHWKYICEHQKLSPIFVKKIKNKIWVPSLERNTKIDWVCKATPENFYDFQNPCILTLNNDILITRKFYPERSILEVFDFGDRFIYVKDGKYFTINSICAKIIKYT